ncbi:MAG: ferredoxin [Solirubrobacteraceae bacterium]|jgi:NAD-dependent dihydropyrimidine dehydrogenase PreA subunit|nr:ferredoxin [Solirubrobacteraceae bacterium]MEA2317908.1 ferredoxin [Solirubrobacteraceae bacterium]
MRADAIFIGIEVDEAVAGDGALAAKLAETCPVDIYADAGGRVEIVERNIDECILCGMCIDVSPPGTVRVHRLYEAEVRV